MFETLDDEYRQEVYQGGKWIVEPIANFKRLDPNFQVPTEPLWVKVPPEQLVCLSKICSSIRPPPAAVYRDDSPELSGPELRAKRLRSQGKPFFSHFYFLFTEFPHLLDFGEVPNEGIGRVTHQGNQKQLREVLLTVRQARRRQASPASQVQPLPRLISAKELNELRHEVPPVSLFLVFVLLKLF
jgi:hypothetical protein